MTPRDVFTSIFVPNIERGSYHSKWVQANPGEASRWGPFRDAVEAGQTPAVPSMTTYYGRALIAAGQMTFPPDIFPLSSIYPCATAP